MLRVALFYICQAVFLLVTPWFVAPLLALYFVPSLTELSLILAFAPLALYVLSLFGRGHWLFLALAPLFYFCAHTYYVDPFGFFGRNSGHGPALLVNTTVWFLYAPLAFVLFLYYLWRKIRPS